MSIMNNMPPMPMPMTPPSPPTNNSNDNHGTGMYMYPMHTSFFWGKDVIILFSDWPGEDRLVMYVLALVVVFLLAMSAEIMSGSLKLKQRVNPVVGASVFALVYGVKTVLAYAVMLSVMSYNVGVFLAAVFGHGLGFFLVKYRELVAFSKAVDLSAGI